MDDALVHFWHCCRIHAFLQSTARKRFARRRRATIRPIVAGRRLGGLADSVRARGWTYAAGLWDVQRKPNVLAVEYRELDRDAGTGLYRSDRLLVAQRATERSAGHG